MQHANLYLENEAAEYSATRSSWSEFRACLSKYIFTDNFLDAGCGTGNDLYGLLKDKNLSGYACDYSSYMLAQAKQKVPMATYTEVNLDKEFPFERMFDVIYSHDVIHQLKTPNVFIKNTYNHLEKNGIFILASEFREGLEQKVTSLYFPNALELDKKRYHSREILHDFCLQSGFHEVEQIRIDDYESFTLQIMEQLRTKSHSILQLLSDHDFATGLVNIEKDFASGKLTKIKRDYTILVMKKSSV